MARSRFLTLTKIWPICFSVGPIGIGALTIFSSRDSVVSYFPVFRGVFAARPEAKKVISGKDAEAPGTANHYPSLSRALILECGDLSPLYSAADSKRRRVGALHIRALPKPQSAFV